jgi:hypothetical protein
MLGISIKHLLVGFFGSVEVFLLLVNMSNLEPDVKLGKRSWRIAHDISEAVKTLGELVLLLVYYTETEINLVGLFEFGIHAHDL